MGGRYTLKTPVRALADHFDVPEFPDIGPRYNVAPTQAVPVVRLDASGAREAVAVRWGLIPSWADDPAIGNKLINARAETVAEKPAYRPAFKSRRCLIPADSFYEWAPTKGWGKIPHLFRLADGGPFAFAGLWERWASKSGDPVESCALVTTTPNELVGPVHDRMPAILGPGDYARWLDPGARPADLAGLLGPFPAGLMVGYAVGRWVNDPRRLC